MAKGLVRQKNLRKVSSMKNLLNSVRLFGNVGKDPVVTKFDNGNKLAKWSMATNERMKSASGDVVDEVQWHQLIAWGNLATMVESYVKKGMKISIEGKLNHRRFVNKEGQERETTEIVVKDILLVERKKREVAEETDDEVPF